MTTGIIILVIVVLLAIWCVSLYNNLVKLRNNRENAFANIDVQLKLRHDLVPQLKLQRKDMPHTSAKCCRELQKHARQQWAPQQ